MNTEERYMLVSMLMALKKEYEDTVEYELRASIRDVLERAKLEDIEREIKNDI